MITVAQVAAARDALMAGGLAIVPTDTVYGLAAALDSPQGVAALYTLKGRPRSQPCQVLVYTEGLLAEALGPLDDRTAMVVRALLPGQVTCIVPDPAHRYSAAAGDDAGAVGIRAPVMFGAILDLDVPLVATSANDPGGADPAVVSEVPQALRAGSMFHLDAGSLPGEASAVIDLRELGAGGPAHLIRHAPSVDAITRHLRAIDVDVAGM